MIRCFLLAEWALGGNLVSNGDDESVDKIAKGSNQGGCFEQNTLNKMTVFPCFSLI